MVNERTTLEVIAPTVEEALAQGLAQLGLPATAVSVEVLDSGNKGLFGLGGRQVRVRLIVTPPGGVSTHLPDRTTASEQAQPPLAAIIPPVAERGNKRTSSRGKRADVVATSSPVVEREPVTTPQTGIPRGLDSPIDGHDTVLDKTEATISKLLFHMSLQAQVSAHYGEAREDRRPIMVDIRGGDLGVLIGRRGETLDAFQYIASLMVGKETGQFVHLVVDVEGHRDRRENQLRQLARRMAEQVIKSGRKLTLEPMRAAERRIIHMELRDHPAVTTQSMGEEPYRKISILPKE